MVEYVAIEKQNGEIHTYNSLAELTAEIELVDVESDIYKVYNSQGIIQNLSIKKKENKVLGLFKIDGSRIIVNDSGEQRSEELIAYISNYARVHGLSINGSMGLVVYCSGMAKGNKGQRPFHVAASPSAACAADHRPHFRCVLP